MSKFYAMDEVCEFSKNLILTWLRCFVHVPIRWARNFVELVDWRVRNRWPLAGHRRFGCVLGVSGGGSGRPRWSM